MAVPLLALVMPPLDAAAVVLPIMILQDGTAVWVYRKDWDGRILAIVIPGAMAGVAAAGVLVVFVSNDAVRLFIGVTTIAFVVHNWIKVLRVPRERPKPGPAAGLFWGAMSGFTSTIAQAGGPPYQIYALAQKMPKMTYVGTSAIYFAVLNWAKVVPYMALGQFPTKGLGTSLLLVPLALATNQLGFWLVRRVSQESFYKITMVLMFFISIERLREGMSGIWRG